MTVSDPLSLQLYSLRNFPPLKPQLAMLKGLGYTNVETFGAQYSDIDDLEQGLKDSGLTAKSGHFALAMVENEPQRAVEIAKRLGIGIVVMPYLLPHERPADRSGWQAIGQRLAGAAKTFDAAGLRFAYHNHDFEFHPLPDGTMPIELLLIEGVLWEADLAWAVKAGADPKPWLQRYRGRVPLVHVKDIAPAGANTDEDGWADVGQGTLDWQDLWREAVAAGAEIMIAEHDNPKSPERFARVSAAAMAGFDRGNA